MSSSQDSEQSGLHRFSDKIQFKTWMLEEGKLGSILFFEGPPVLVGFRRETKGQQTIFGVPQKRHLCCTPRIPIPKIFHLSSESPEVLPVCSLQPLCVVPHQ